MAGPRQYQCRPRTRYSIPRLGRQGAVQQEWHGACPCATFDLVIVCAPGSPSQPAAYLAHGEGTIFAADEADHRTASEADTERSLAEPVAEPERITAIVPATNCPATLGRCLAAIRGAEAAPDQVIVVEDASLRHPALARNAGARKAAGNLLVFVDADVTVHADAFVRIRRVFAADPNLVALFGSYDDAPEAPGIVSVFRNLLHHHVHHDNAGPSSSFWAGLGAIRRDAFEAFGGFSQHPIEDVELGMRLSQSGARILLDPTIQGTHLKDWSFWGMLRTDLLVRGIPWVGLLLEHRGSASTSELNLGWRHRLSALACLALLAALVLPSLWLGVAALGMLVALNFAFYSLLVRRQGLPRAMCGVALHFLHQLVTVVSVPLGILAYQSRRWKSRARVGAA